MTTHGGTTMKKAVESPFDDPSYQRWLEAISLHCHAKYGPCGGCQAGGICDGWMGGDRFEDEEPDEPRDEEDVDE